MNKSFLETKRKKDCLDYIIENERIGICKIVL